MATYYGQGPDGQMGHIRLNETLEQWHLRCAEDHERIRGLREDIPRGYSWKGLQKDVRSLKEHSAHADQELCDLREVTRLLSEGLALVAHVLGMPVTFAPVVDGQVQLPCPEHGEECTSWPSCTD